MHSIQVAPPLEVYDSSEASTNYGPYRKTKCCDPQFKPSTPLWVPNTNIPNIGKAFFQRNRHLSLAHNPSRRLNPSKDHGSKSRKPGLLQRNIRPQALKPQEQSMSNEPNPTDLEESQRSTRGTERGLSGDDSPPGEKPLEDLEAEPKMLLQSDIRPISHEQLVVEVKGIYAGLVMVEAKCIDIDERQSTAAQEKRNDQWQSLIALHKQLLHEHHDFFLASQHPSTSPAMSRLATKYSLPARMWRHGVHAFLEVLRHRLPDSLEHMLAFVYIAYSMISLCYEAIHDFEDTWIACLGDLGRYRRIVEDDQPGDHEVWNNVAQLWYNKAADKSPNVGRLYHHLAILARPYTVEQLSLYTRSLTCITPFESVKGSIMTLFNPILNGKEAATRRFSSFKTIFIRAHEILFTNGPVNSVKRFYDATKKLEADDLLDCYVTNLDTEFKEIGVFAAVTNVATFFEYGRIHDSRKSGIEFPKPAGKAYPLPDDFIIRGQLYNQWYFPEDWSIATIVDDDDERLCGLPSIAQLRIEAMIRLGHQIASAYHTFSSLQVKEHIVLDSKGIMRTRTERSSRSGHQITSVSRSIDHTKYCSRVKNYAALIVRSLRRKTLFLNFSLLAPFIASFLPAVSASPIGNPDKTDNPFSIASLVSLFASSIYVGFAAMALAMAHSLAAKKGPTRVWACMMAISAYGWWAVKTDVTASLSLSIADLGVWAISALQYGNITFQEFRIPERMSLITLLVAAILDLAIVSFMTPSGAPISQSDLLSLSLPAMSLSLAIMVNLVGSFRNEPPAPPPSHEMGTRVSANGGDPYYEGPFPQRPSIPYPGTSRLLLFENPLSEDSSRIWDTDE